MTREPGTEASVVFPPRKTATRARLLAVEPDGSLTFVCPRTGGLRTVHPEAVRRWHRKQRMEKR